MVAHTINDMMRDKSDYKSFFYRPISANLYRVSQEGMKKEDTHGYN